MLKHVVHILTITSYMVTYHNRISGRRGPLRYVGSRPCTHHSHRWRISHRWINQSGCRKYYHVVVICFPFHFRDALPPSLVWHWKGWYRPERATGGWVSDSKASQHAVETVKRGPRCLVVCRQYEKRSQRGRRRWVTCISPCPSNHLF